MKALRLAVLASAVAAAGCAGVSPPDNTYAFKQGNGTVENVRQARVQVPGGGAPSTAFKRFTEPSWIDGYQLSLRMDDGTTQAITQDSAAFHAGERIQVTSNGRIVRLPAGAPAAVALRAGTGTVQSAAAGGSAASQQITVGMDDGTTQLINVQGATLQPGQRVTVTADGRVLQ